MSKDQMIVRAGGVLVWKGAQDTPCTLEATTEELAFWVKWATTWDDNKWRVYGKIFGRWIDRVAMMQNHDMLGRS